MDNVSFRKSRISPFLYMVSEERMLKFAAWYQSIPTKVSTGSNKPKNCDTLIFPVFSYICLLNHNLFAIKSSPSS